MISKLNMTVRSHEKARSEQFNAVTAKVDEIIDAINSGNVGGGGGTVPDDALSAMLSSEAASVDTNSAGVTTKGTNVLTTMTVYYGTTKYQMSDLYTDYPSMSTCNKRTGLVSIAIPSGYNLLNGLNVTITAVTAKGSISKIFSISANRKGEDGDGIVNMGEWEDGLYVPYGATVRMGSSTYQCTNENGTTNPPVDIYKDKDGNYLMFNNGGYVIADTVATEDYILLTTDGATGDDGKTYTPTFTNDGKLYFEENGGAPEASSAASAVDILGKAGITKNGNKITLGGVAFENGVITIGAGATGIKISQGGILLTKKEAGMSSAAQVEINPSGICGASTSTSCNQMGNTGLSPYVSSSTSDVRLKDVHEAIELSTEEIADAPIFDFSFKHDDGRVHTGTSAQYWADVLPNTVRVGCDGYLGLEYAQAAMVAVVSLARRVKELEGRIKKLEGHGDK